MTSQPSTFIAPHLREAVFREYEPLIRNAVALFPEETCYIPDPKKSPITFVAGFRNALLSARTFNWSTDADLAKLRSLAGQYIVRLEADGMVWFRAKRPTVKPVSVHTDPPYEPSPTSSRRSRHSEHPPSSASPVPWGDMTEEEIRALCLLLHHGRLTGPFLVTGPVSEGLTNALLSTFNVGIVWDADTKTTIIT